MDFLSDLNPSQREAVVHTEGPSLVIAGAGSGKTRVLTYRIAYLLAQGVPANQILALTFTNKAAREMKERITLLVGEAPARYLWMGTFHSVASRMLRHHADRLGFTRDFSIYDTQDTKSLVKQLVKEMQLDDKVYKPAVVLSRISAAKNALLPPEAYAANSDISRRDRYDRMYAMPELYSLYRLRLMQANAMDFDDLLMNLCLLLRQDEEVRNYYRQIFRYVLVDEYQDTNYVQYLIVNMLAQPENNICVVGDDAQSIYSFRGADIRNILTFQQGYPDAQLFKLERNYRSTKNIVEAAGSLIRHNERQIPKQVYSENEEGDRLPVTAYMTDRDEASGIVASISRNSRMNGERYEDTAILYRTNAQSRILENELRRADIPYRIYGGMSFYQRKEVKDAIAYLRVMANPRDNESLLRIINFPARGIGATTVNRIAACAAANRVSAMEVMRMPQPIPLDISSATRKKIDGFLNLIDNMAKEADSMDAFLFADFVLKTSGVMAAAAADNTPEGRDRKQNLDELLSGIHELVDRRLQEGVAFTPVQDFLAEVSLLTDQDENLNDNTERVTLMTIHSAKGLEFPSVYIAGLEENLFPSQHCVHESEIEEERRLLYVAVTRAMKHCRLSYAMQRFRNGRTDICLPSRFLKDFDPKYLRRTDSNRLTFSASFSAEYDPDYPVRRQESPAIRHIVPSASVTAIDHAEYKEGDRVRHRVFGTGTVQRVYRHNDNEKIDILFDNVGSKTLLLTYAKLERC